MRGQTNTLSLIAILISPNPVSLKSSWVGSNPTQPVIYMYLGHHETLNPSNLGPGPNKSLDPFLLRYTSIHTSPHTPSLRL